MAAMAQDLDTVNTGTRANGRDGDPLRTAFSKVNDAIIALNALLTDYEAGESLSLLSPMHADTIPLFTAGYGWGAATDTTGIDITADFGGWYNDGSDTVQLAKVIGIVKASKNAPTVTVNVYWDVNYYDATPDSAFTAGLAVTSTSAGTSGTSFAKAKIPPHVWVWVKPCRSLGTTGTKPSKLRISVSGYKIPKY